MHRALTIALAIALLASIPARARAWVPVVPVFMGHGAGPYLFTPPPYDAVGVPQHRYFGDGWDATHSSPWVIELGLGFAELVDLPSSNEFVPRTNGSGVAFQLRARAYIAGHAYVGGEFAALTATPPAGFAWTYGGAALGAFAGWTFRFAPVDIRVELAGALGVFTLPGHETAPQAALGPRVAFDLWTGPSWTFGLQLGALFGDTQDFSAVLTVALHTRPFDGFG